MRDLHTGENALTRRLRLQQEEIDRSTVVRVPIESLSTSGSPRLGGEDEAHVRTLADSGGALPPIVVHLPSRKVIDGMHRLRAAILRGEREIDARFFHGTESDVFLLAVVANTKHGLPLSQQDRAAAAKRIFEMHPEWSDRMVAVVVGVSAKKVATLRREMAGHIPETTVRIGRDGKSRPLDSTAGRERAAQLIMNDPGASLRDIARAAGISPATAADVRDRIARGENPVPARFSAKGRPQHPREPAENLNIAPPALSAEALSELAANVERLRKDPSLRFSEVGRALLRMYESCQVIAHHKDAVKNGIPPHRLAMMTELSHAYARILRSLSEELRELRPSDTADGDGERAG
ncbi:ParB N-terminal domain-containing protein [Actinomadura sp. NBRC 104412]|uniref:ParB/RepB/Spo0J family partition protein n=1 Tax=Actinomadura sp. NBRC 104412 TaxID=3032203 RepID=UPI002555C7D8|nr:ParB N-terminal domain-containing protein [Actinomadura sp. NBRC 104412]